MKKLVLVMEKIADVAERIINVLITVMLTVLFLTVVLSVLTRNINQPVVWLGELGTFSCVWAIFLGMALAYRKDMFPNVDLLNLLLPERIRQYLPLLYDVLIQFFLITILVSSRIFLRHLFTSGQISPELRILMFYAYLGPVIGYVFTAFFSLTGMFTRILGYINPETAKERSV